MLSINDIFDESLPDNELIAYVNEKWKEKDGFYSFLASLSDEQLFKFNKAVNKFQHPIRGQYRLYDFLNLKINKYAKRIDLERKRDRINSTDWR
jgi:hypothetical protein